MALTRQMPTTIIIPRDATREQSFRLWADVLRLWRLCGNASCRRCRACRGKSRACFSANYPLLPDGVREYFDALGQAHRDGLTFDDALEELDGSDEDEAFRAWTSAVDASARPRKSGPTGR